MRKLVLFDLDNTLLPFHSYWEKANVEIFNSSSLTKNLNYESFINLYRKYDKELWELHLQQLISLDELRQQRLIKTLNDFEIKISIDESQNYFVEFFNFLINSIVSDEKINNMLLSIKEYYDIGILTNGKISEQKQKIKKMKLNDIISWDHIFISDEIGYEKPDPKAFHYALDNLNVNYEQAIYVGDSWSNDIVGSINAGMRAIWISEDKIIPESTVITKSKIIKIPSIFDLEESLLPVGNL
ncbi:HAD family hydrolase [Priestia megaterium]|nr:HAD family hydrolase [Priestia megaterium]